MQRIDEIVLEQAVEVKVICELDQNILGKNFAIVMDCLRELRDKQAEHDDWIR